MHGGNTLHYIKRHKIKPRKYQWRLLHDLCHHRSSGNNEDYLMGGHSIGIIPMAISLCASFNSAYMILGEKYFIDSYGHFYMILGEMY